jgi:hypothetical protein
VAIKPVDRHGMTEKRMEHRFYAAFFITGFFLGPAEAGRGRKKALDKGFFSNKNNIIFNLI